MVVLECDVKCIGGGGIWHGAGENAARIGAALLTYRGKVLLGEGDVERHLSYANV